jgi:alcohol dehydrogenase
MIYRDEPDPSPAAGEVLVAIDAVGICGSDLHAYHGQDARRHPPVVMGHEAVGHIAEGPDAGRRVALNPLIACGACRACGADRAHLCEARRQFSVHRPGAFAELMAVPATNLIELPEGLDVVKAALAEPTAVALHAVDRIRAFPNRSLGDADALVIGGGSIGLLCALLLNLEGCRSVRLCDINPLRRRTAIAAGIENVFDPADGEARLSGSFDVVVDAVGIKATRQASQDAVCPGGLILHVGLGDDAGGIDFRKLTRNEVALIGAARSTAGDLRRAIALLHSDKLDTSRWVERRPLAVGAEAFAEIDKGQAAAAKVVLVPGS